MSSNESKLTADDVSTSVGSKRDLTVVKFDRVLCDGPCSGDGACVTVGCAEPEFIGLTMCGCMLQAQCARIACYGKNGTLTLPLGCTSKPFS